MGKQQENKITPRQSVYNDLGLEKNNVTYDQFSKMFDENEDFRKSVYNDLGFEGQGVNYDKFYTIMGKPTEVSAQGSAPTSQTSVEPGRTEQLPTSEQAQQTGTSSLPSLAGQISQANKIAGEYGLQQGESYEIENLPGYETLVGRMDAQGRLLNPVRVNEETGEMQNIIQPVDLAPTREEAVAQNEAIKVAEMGAGEKALNSIQNMWTHVKGVPAKAAILFDQNARFDASRFLTLYGVTNLAGTNPNQLRDDAYKYLDDLGAEMKQTGSIVDGLRNNDIGELAAGVFNATTSLLSSMAIGATTGGSGTVLDMVGGGVYDYNTKKAEDLGISTEELFKQGKGDDIAPYIINSAAAGLERIGFNGVTAAINRNLTGSAARKAGLFAFDSSKEAGTEWVQEGLSAYNEVIASGGTHEQAIEAMGQTMASDRGIEAALGGFFGATAAASGGRAIKGLVGKVAKQKATTAQETIQQISQDYVNNPDPEIRQTLIDAAVDASDQMLEATNESKKAVQNLTPENREKVVDAQLSIDKIDETIANGNLSDATVKALEERKSTLESEVDKMITTKEPDENLSSERVDALVEENRKRFPELADVDMGEVDVPDFVIDTLAKVESDTAISDKERSDSIDALYKKKNELKSMLKDPNRSHTSKEINDALSLIDKDLDLINDFYPTIKPDDFSTAKPGDKFAEGEVKSASVASDGSIDVVFTDGSKINSNENTKVGVDPVAENAEISPVGEQEQQTQEVVNEETVSEVVEPSQGIGPQNQNVDAQQNEIDMSLVPPRPEPQEVQTTVRAQMEPRSSFANTDEYQRSLAEQSNNPDEIAYEYARTEAREADPIEQGIMDYIGSGRINAKDFAEYGDSNWLEDMDAKTRRRWINSDNTEGLSLDQMAQELSSNLDMEVTPEDIIGVIMDFGGRGDFDASRKTEGQKALEQKYKELTGKNLTPYVAKRTADMMDRRVAELTDDQRAAVDENLQDLGITYQDILDYEEFNRQIAESGPGGLQQSQVNQGAVPQSIEPSEGSQGTEVEQQGQVDETETESTVQTNERKAVPSKKEQKVAESSKVEAKRRESALSGTPSKIREGIKVPSDLPGSRGSAIAGDAFNEAADVTARAIENGSSLDEAISQGIGNLKKSYWYRTLPKESKKQAEQSFRDAVNGANEMVYAEQNPSAKNARSQKLREKYGFGDRIIPETQGSNEILAEARADIREGRVFPIDVVNKGLSGKQLTAKEQAIIVEYMNQLETEVAMQSDRIENDNTMTPEAFSEVDKMREEALNKLSAAIYALERTGTEIARALASRKWIVNRDVSLPSMISMKRKANGNVPLTTEQLESVRREFDGIMKDKARVDKRMAEIEAELSIAKADIVMMAEAHKAELEYRKTKDKAGSKKEALTDIQARRAEAKQALKDAVSKIAKLGFAYNPKQQAQYDADFLSALGSLLKTYFDEALLRSGKVNYNAIINNITRDLQAAHPSITKEQVAQMIDSLDTDTRPTLQSLRAEVASLKEEIKTHNLESEKQSIRRRIDNINEKIKSKDYKTVPSGLEKYDAEYRQLKKQLDDRIYEFKVEMERDKLRRRGLLHKAFSYSSEIFALPRALMATGDLSAPLRQGIVAMVGNPRTGIRAFKEMHKMALNEAYYEAYHEAVRDSEMYDLATRSGLSLSGVGNNVWTTLREEQWTSRLINKVPVLKNVAAFSERGFAGFLNKMRFDLFNQGAELLMNEGKSFQTHPDQFKAVATYVNAVTGRGPVPSRWEGMFGDLSTALFAPRLITSRLYLLLGGPIVSAVRSGNWNVAKSYVKDMAGFISFGVGTMFLASMLDGVSIEGDDEDEPLFTQGAADTWTKGDFLNIRVGDTRYDIWGGFAQYIRLFSRIITGQTTSSSGKVKIAADAKSIGDTELGWILRFGQSKLSPTAAFAVGFLSHRNYMGDPFNPVDELQNMAWPLVFQETAESMFGGEDFRPEALATIFLPSAYGVGVQTWSSNSFLKNGTDNKLIDVLTKKKLNTMSKRQQDVTVIEPSTGESRKVTDEEFAQYKKVWDDYVKNELNKNIDKIEKMSESKAENEFNNIKRAATVLAKKSITGVSSEDTRIEFDKKTYDLDGDLLKRRLKYMDQYREANGQRYNNQYPKELKRDNPSITPEEIKISIEKQMDKDARSYSREKILDDYVKGRIKLVEK